MTLIIRDATPADAPAIAALLGELGYPAQAEEVRHRLAKLVLGDEVVILLATCDEQTVGLASCHVMRVLHESAPVGFLGALVVTGSRRREGIGRKLIAAIEAEAVARGCRRVTLTSAERRVSAHAFYERLGYVHTGRRFAKQFTG